MTIATITLQEQAAAPAAHPVHLPIRRRHSLKRRISASCPENVEAMALDAQPAKKCGEIPSNFLPETGCASAMDIDSVPSCVEFQDYVPTNYSFGPIHKDTIISSVAAVLHSWVDNAPTAPTSLFTGRASVSMTQFVSALVELLDYLRCDDTVLLTALCYIKRLSLGLYAVSAMNVFRLLLSSMLASIKYNDDIGISNIQFAQLVGLELKDIMALELNFMPLLQYKLYVPEAEFAGVCEEVRNIALNTVC
eukprot:TRINITY_DN1840_c1_g2_i1.p1 TRINITY_DN1840_c1_g2~~TRINITY_DN1840_c1_g2_i1.p1  ORF type:complete len:250 (+),score=57.18 TRINITY_DN1840_c1_g2_i1:76-825(+)